MGVHQTNSSTSMVDNGFSQGIKDLLQIVGLSHEEAQCIVDQDDARLKLNALQKEIESHEKDFQIFVYSSNEQDKDYQAKLSAFEKKSTELKEQWQELEAILQGECVEVHWDIAGIPEMGVADALTDGARVAKAARWQRFTPPQFLLPQAQKQLRSSQASFHRIDDLTAVIYAGSPAMSVAHKLQIAGGALFIGGSAVAAWHVIFGEEERPNGSKAPKPKTPRQEELEKMRYAPRPEKPEAVDPFGLPSEDTAQAVSYSDSTEDESTEGVHPKPKKPDEAPKTDLEIVNEIRERNGLGPISQEFYDSLKIDVFNLYK